MLLSRPPLTPRRMPVRLACFRHAASVYPEPGSNSPSELPRTLVLSDLAGSPSPHHSSLVKVPRPSVGCPISRCGLVVYPRLPPSVKPGSSFRRWLRRDKKPKRLAATWESRPSADAVCPPLALVGTLPCCSPWSLLPRAVPRPVAQTFWRPPCRRPVLATTLC